MGVLDKVFGKKQEVQPPTIPVTEKTQEQFALTPSAPPVSEIMRGIVSEPLEPQVMTPIPSASPTLEERRVEDVVPRDVFVKLDNFGDMLSELTIIRNSIVNLKSLTMIKNDMKDMESDLISLIQSYTDGMEKSVSHVEEIIEGVSSAAKQAKDVKFKAAKPMKSRAVEDLESRIKKLRGEIEGLSKV